jgi:hypothetical protein
MDKAKNGSATVANAAKAKAKGNDSKRQHHQQHQASQAISHTALSQQIPQKNRANATVEKKIQLPWPDNFINGPPPPPFPPQDLMPAPIDKSEQPITVFTARCMGITLLTTVPTAG